MYSEMNARQPFRNRSSDGFCFISSSPTFLIFCYKSQWNERRTGRTTAQHPSTLIWFPFFPRQRERKCYCGFRPVAFFVVCVELYLIKVHDNWSSKVQNVVLGEEWKWKPSRLIDSEFYWANSYDSQTLFVCRFLKAFVLQTTKCKKIARTIWR
jgi:hypothetical protein